MTIQHHPDEALLSGFAAGTLDLGQRAAIATHLVSCAQCRGAARMLEQVGGTVLGDLPPTPVAADALTCVQARLAQPGRAVETAKASSAADVAGLPAFVRRYRFGKWQWVAPRVALRRIALPWPSETRIFLLRSGPGTRMLQHSHTGIEMTCVLSGAFAHDGGHFGPGDFDFGDDMVDHRPTVDPGEDCICLIAMQGQLQLKGLLGRLMQPLVRL